MGARTHYFMGACALIILGARRALIFKRARRALIFKRAQALIVQRQTSKEQLQSGHERIVHEMLSWKNGCARTHYFWGLDEHRLFWDLDEHRFSRGREHSSFREHSIRELMNEHIWIWKESQRISSWSTPLKNGGAHPLFYGGMRTRYFGGSTSTDYFGGSTSTHF